MEPFAIEIEPAVLADLHDRLDRTRWPDELPGTGWDYGTNLAYLRELAAYWRRDFAWNAQAAALNRYPHYRVESGWGRIHVQVAPGQGPAPAPLLLLHGWPSSFVQMQKILPLLSDPASHGGSAADSFTVVAASLPGYGFSDRPSVPGMSVARVAAAMHTVMTERLGYPRFAVRGTDLGAGVATQLALTFPKALLGVHTGGTNPWLGEIPADLTPPEQAFVVSAQQWAQTEMAYAMAQSTRPQTLAYGLNDSPVGLAAWIIEKFRRWSDCDGDLERSFSRDDLLTNLTIYWATGTINSSMRLYYETVRDAGAWGRSPVPVAYAMPPGDMFPTPRSWVERSSRVDRWTELPAGGHFPEWEVPVPLAADIREFFRPLREPANG